MPTQESADVLITEKNTKKEIWNTPQLETIGIVGVTESNFGFGGDASTSSS